MQVRTILSQAQARSCYDALLQLHKIALVTRQGVWFDCLGGEPITVTLSADGECFVSRGRSMGTKELERYAGIEAFAAAHQVWGD